MSVDVYPAQPHPNKRDYARAIQIVESDTFSVADKKAKLEAIGFFYNGTNVLNAGVFNRADAIITNTTYTDQQKINRLQNLGFAFKPQTAATPLPAATVTHTGLPLWAWFAGGAALLMILK